MPHLYEAAGVMMYGFIPVLFAFGIHFIALRIRDTRATPGDPHLGRKCVGYLFFNLAIIMILIGLTQSSLDLTEHFFEPAILAQEQRQKGEDAPVDPALGPPPPSPPHVWFNDSQRTALGLVVSGLFHALIFAAVLRFFTNDREFPAARRAFASSRFALCGLVMMAVSTLTIVLLFQSGELELKKLQPYIAIAVVWGPAAAIHLWLMLKSSGWRREPAV